MFPGILYVFAFLAVVICESLGCGVDLRDCSCNCGCISRSNFSKTQEKAIVTRKGILNDDGECVCACNCEDEDAVPNNNGLCEHCSVYGELVHVRGDCTKFCVCQYLDYQHLNKIKDCPSGLFFDYGMQRCEWPLTALCSYKDGRNLK